MKRALSTVVAIALLLGLGALAVLALPGMQVAVNTAQAAPVALAAAPAPRTAAAPDAPASTSGLNWIAIPLSNASLVNASDLATDIETTTGSTVSTVEQWNAQSQNYLTYLHDIGLDDYALTVGYAYRVSVTGGTGGLVWSLVGDVPDPSTFTYTLYETASTDFNWIMLPLDKDTITWASELAADIEANSSGAVTVSTIEQWNASAQNYLTYLHDIGLDDFSVRIGYPYRVTLDVTTGSSVTWPVR